MKGIVIFMALGFVLIVIGTALGNAKEDRLRRKCEASGGDLMWSKRGYHYCLDRKAILPLAAE